MTTFSTSDMCSGGAQIKQATFPSLTTLWKPSHVIYLKCKHEEQWKNQRYGPL
jgi:hypothetical protein